MSRRPYRHARRAGGGAETNTILRHWRVAVPNDRLAHLVKDATRAFLRALQMRIARHNVPLGHWTFLRILWERDGLTQRELSDLAGVMEPTTFIAVKAMEKLGYIERRQRPDNRKKIYVFLTVKGRRLKRKLVPLAINVNEVAARGVPAEDIAATRRTLLAILENLAMDESRRANGHAPASRPRRPPRRASPRPATPRKRAGKRK
jgi:DNA-binding MarR family transcriptional regulator